MIIPFEKEYREKFYASLDDIFDSNFWSEGKNIKRFEQEFEKFTGIPSRTISNGGAGLLAILDYINVTGSEVIVPSNTFWATAQSVIKAGGTPVFADCNKEDLCMSFESMKKLVTKKTKAIIVVHIGGHIAFEIEEIAKFCNENNIKLVEDCAHVHGGTFNGKTGGDWGFAGSYSFYATKTMPTGDGGMVVSHNKDFLNWLEKYRNYGKEIVNGVVTYPIKNGFNYRMPEFVAALGLVQLERMPQILHWKRELAKKYDDIFPNTVKFPKGMVSGYYKYIVFNQNLKEKTGQVFGPNDLGHVISNSNVDLPNSMWAVNNHQCAPIYYGWEGFDQSVQELRSRLV